MFIEKKKDCKLGLYTKDEMLLLTQMEAYNNLN